MMIRQSLQDDGTIHNIFSCDVEDWYQSCHDVSAAISERVYRNVDRCLELLGKNNVRGTFFIQGLVAEQRPEVVKLIDRSGHEIGSHGYSHKPIFQMTRTQFRDELRKTNELIENITGKKVKGFRAPDFTIFNGMHFALEVLEECGIMYDSSIFPVQTRRYGNPGSYPGIFKIKGYNLVEFPITIYFNWKLKIPVAGGGYIRLLPLRFLKKVLHSINAEGRPFVMYCHPYEFDPDEWSCILQKISIFRKLHQGIGRKTFPLKIIDMMNGNNFCSFEESLKLLAYIPEKECL
jgi:polysaccharide deacetylase family protein (PEP-CTERM system associated)